MKVCQLEKVAKCDLLSFLEYVKMLKDTYNVYKYSSLVELLTEHGAKHADAYVLE